MRRLIPLLLALPLLAGEAGAVRKLKIEGFEKPVLLYVPEGYTPEKTWGLALFLHGTGMNGAHMLQGFSGHLEAMGRAGYLSAFPSSNHTAWGTGGSGTVQIKARELKLLRQAVETILKEYKVDDRCVHTYGFSCGTVILALGVGFRDEWDGLGIRSVCGNSGGLSGQPLPAKASRAKETAVWILNGEQDPAHAEISRNVHEAFKAGGYDSRYTVAWGIDHGFPLATPLEMLRWWRSLDGERMTGHSDVPAAEEGYEVPMSPPGSAAARAGLQVGDRLLSADGSPLNTTEDVSRAFSGRRPGDKARIKVRRGKKEFEVVLRF